MKNKIVLSVLTAILAFTLFLGQASVVSAAGNAPENPRGRGGNGSSAGQASTGVGVALSPLSSEEGAALQEAILEEYVAYNLYQSVIAQLGNVAPFSQIVRAEQQHINALVRQAQKYGVAVPANPGLSATPTFDTLAEACQAGVSAEIADAQLYDTLKTVTTHSDLLQVYTRLQSASLNSHLPAFQYCD